MPVTLRTRDMIAHYANSDAPADAQAPMEWSYSGQYDMERVGTISSFLCRTYGDAVAESSVHRYRRCR